MKELFDQKLWKFLLVGVANTLVGSVAMFGCYNLGAGLLGCPPPPTISAAAS